MREILFRGKCLEFGSWIWIEGYYAKDDKESYIYHPSTTFNKGKSVTLIPFIPRPETVGQFAGLPDKNGTNIFEGDILSSFLPNEYFVVVYHNSSFKVQYYPEYANNGSEVWHTLEEYLKINIRHSTNYVEVMGNIHDNPELIKGV